MAMIPTSSVPTSMPGIGSGGGGFDPQAIASGVSGGISALGGLYQMFGSGAGSIQGTSQAAAAAADPFAAQRGQYQSMLQGLMTDPSKIALTPGAQFQMDQGLEALQRSGAARGFLGSGNILGELMKYSQGLASQDYYNQLNQLNLLSGATTGSPAAAASAIAATYPQYNQAASDVGGGIGGILGGVGSLLGGLF